MNACAARHTLLIRHIVSAGHRNRGERSVRKLRAQYGQAGRPHQDRIDGHEQYREFVRVLHYPVVYAESGRGLYEENG